MAARWDVWGLSQLHRHLIDIQRDDHATCVPAEYITGAGIHIRHAQTFSASANGSIQIEEVVDIPPELEDLPRVGTVFELRPGLEQLVNYGRGPHECYPDRRRAALIGKSRSSVSEQYVPYIRPQENGGHADVRWFTLDGVRVELDRPTQVSVLHFRDADLATASHDVELTPCAETVAHLDAAQRGLGTASCGPDTLAQYVVGPGRYRWTWSLASTSEA
jgi:beta-galactosidase